jgi:hypothetical protein
VVAVQTEQGVFLSWRLFQYDYPDIGFNVYKNNGSKPINSAVLRAAYTDYLDPTGTGADTYQVLVLSGDREVARSETVSAWSKDYLSIPVEKPTTGHLPDGTAYADYHINDGVAADLDGDGQNEILFFWVPANSKDNSQSGKTANVFIDAYTLQGKKFWGAGKYIDLGTNIRAGAHYQTFVVDDFDGDGKAEIAVKTADGTTDTQGKMILTDEDGTLTLVSVGGGYIPRFN